MKHTFSMILTSAVIFSVLVGCGAAEKPSSTSVLTVRIVNQSAVDLYGIAVGYSANGETLGSKACEQIKEEAEQTVYEVRFAADELPAAPIDAFRLDVFAAEKAGEDYSDCGSAVIKGAQIGGVYTLTLNGDEAAALTLSAAERDVEIVTSERAAQEG